MAFEHSSPGTCMLADDVKTHQRLLQESGEHHETPERDEHYD